MRAEELGGMFAFGVFDFLEVQEANRGAAIENVVAVILSRSACRQDVKCRMSTHLLVRHGIVCQTDMREPHEPLQAIQIRQLRDIVLCEHERSQIRQALAQTRLNVMYSISCQ